MTTDRPGPLISHREWIALATALAELPPTPTSLTLIRPDMAIDEGSSEPTRQEPIAPLAQQVNPPFDANERFHQLYVHGSGGQGQVFVAWDGQLRRDVAVKVLKTRHANKSISRARFLREAEIAGGLEHPGVVPVYALGQQADGRPYYAMRLINGRTLHDAIRDYHHPNHVRTAAERNVLFRQLLQRFISVCQTIAFAHARGIVHRDIKPSNVLIGSYGEAVVVDWGLARSYDAATGCAADTDEFPIVSDGDTPDSDSTQMGAAVGTPAFMSPEQAEGRWDLVGPTSDVYALGATLYVLITGALPLHDLPWAEMARRIRAGEIPAPRQVNSHVPRALDAVCRQAMALDPGDRYETAAALAADLEHWLADEPVAAGAEPLGDRARRWVRRHKTFVSAVAVLWASLAVALGIGLVAVDRERVRTETARQQTRAALDRATSKVIDEWLGQQRELRPEHREFLNQALKDYEQFAGDTAHDQVGRLSVVRAYRRVAEIRHRLGQRQEAGEAIARAQELAELHRQHYPADLDGQKELASVFSVLGSLERDGQRPVEAERHFSSALQLGVELDSARPDDREMQQALASGYNNRAVVLMTLNRKPEAVEAFRAALALRDKLNRLRGSIEDRRLEDRRLLAIAHGNLANCLMCQQQFAEAESEFRTATEICLALDAESPGQNSIAEALALAAQKLGSLLYLRNRPDEARPWLVRAAEQYERLCVLYPSVDDFVRESAALRITLGKFDMEAGAGDAGLSQFDRVVERMRSTGRRPTARENAILKAAHAGRAEALDRVQRHADAAAAWDAVAALAPAQRPIWESCRAMQWLKAGRRSEALAEVDRLAGGQMTPSEALYNCACILTREGSDRGRAQAVVLLQQAAKARYFHDAEMRKHLDSDADLAPLRDRSDYRHFRANLGS